MIDSYSFEGLILETLYIRHHSLLLPGGKPKTFPESIPETDAEEQLQQSDSDPKRQSQVAIAEQDTEDDSSQEDGDGIAEDNGDGDGYGSTSYPGEQGPVGSTVSIALLGKDSVLAIRLGSLIYYSS
jgi:hypothetical protein